MSDAPEEPPEGPTGVWAVYPDGERFDNLPTIYLGTDEDGVASFELLTPREGAIWRVGAAHWPGQTSLTIPHMLPGSEPNV